MLNLSIPTKIATWPELVKTWPYLATFADEVQAPLFRVKGWMQRKSVPSRYFPAIIKALAARGIGPVTEADLANLAWQTKETT